MSAVLVLGWGCGGLSVGTGGCCGCGGRSVVGSWVSPLLVLAWDFGGLSVGGIPIALLPSPVSPVYLLVCVACAAC